MPKGPIGKAYGQIVVFWLQSFYYENSITLAGFDGQLASDTICD
jgi:hypothetical protein